MIANKFQKLEGYRLLMPAVAVGNVGQLAVDLLLSTLEVEHVGYLRHPSVLPMVGPDPFDANSRRIVTSWEVYAYHKEKLAIVQQRSPIARGKVEEYKKYLIDWIKQHRFSSVVILSSSFAQYFTADELQNVPVHYLCTSPIVALEEVFSNLKWMKFSLEGKTGVEDKLRIPGGGATELLFEACEEEKISLVVMILVCSEGNNFPEGIKMADCLNSWLKLHEKEEGKSCAWKIPISWSAPFGNRPPPTMF